MFKFFSLACSILTPYFRDHGTLHSTNHRLWHICLQPRHSSHMIIFCQDLIQSHTFHTYLTLIMLRQRETSFISHSYIPCTLALRRTLSMRNLIHTSFIHFLRSLRLAEHCQRETSFIPHSYIPCAHCASQNTANEKPHSYLIHTFLAPIASRRTLSTRNFIHTSFIYSLHSLHFAEHCQ